MDIIQKICCLPDYIILLIGEFLPCQKLVFINKTFYNLYHPLIKKYIPFYENFIRDMIRRDNEFVFERIIRENFDIWIKCKEFTYKNMIFNNYIYFLNYYCIENNSEKCREIIMEYLSKRHLRRNLYKKKTVKYIKWKN